MSSLVASSLVASLLGGEVTGYLSLHPEVHCVNGYHSIVSQRNLMKCDFEE